MSKVTIELADEDFLKLQTLAQERGGTPEALLQDCVKEWLSNSRESFLHTARSVLERNKELYRRLSHCSS